MFLELRFNFVSRWLTLEGRLSKKNPLETRLHLLYIEISNKFYKDEKRFKTDKSTKGKFKKIEIVASLDYYVFNCFNWYWKFMNFRDTFGNKEVLVIFLKISWHFFFIRRTIAWKGKLKLGHVFYYTLSKILIYSFFFCWFISDALSDLVSLSFAQLQNVKNSHGRVLLLVKLQAKRLKLY